MPCDNMLNTAFGHPVFYGKCSIRNYVRNVFGSDLHHLFLRKNMLNMPLSLGVVSSSFFKHVLNIIFGRSNKYVARIATFPIIASVTRHFLMRNRAVLDFPCNPMRNRSCAFASKRIENPIASIHYFSNKRPAFIICSALHLVPKPVLEWSFLKVSPSSERAPKSFRDIFQRCVWAFESHIVRIMRFYEFGST